ncbi:MAG: family 16 glycosylhydrolase [Ruminococcus sp.]|nr:family 16 glycosylhydrolase [Ruminococcus sp.]
MNKHKIINRLISLTLTATLPFAVPIPASAENNTADIFYEDFSGDILNSDKWLIAEKNWGGTVTVGGKTEDYNGGVIADNVTLRDGNLVLTGLGNDYEGELKGINRDKSRREDGKRCGGAIATREYFGSGSYEIRAKIAPELGCCSAMWTFEYEEHYSEDKLQIVNHEIDIEFPGRDENDNFSLTHALCTTWTGEGDNEHKTAIPYCGNQADGEFHTYRFDWHTGSETETPRVDYYFDDVLTYTSYDFIPTNESRFWLGLWFPKNWAGSPDFDQTEFEVDYVRIITFHESGDTPQNESYPDSGWSEKAMLPKGWLLWHNYSDYSALDSKLYLRSPNGTTQTISGDFVHAMNGYFGNSPEQFTFMAIDRKADEWDVFLYDNGEITNLTQNSGFRNEDPKFSPNGKSIIFKRGYWSNSANDFVYDLALLDIETREVTMLTDTPTEEAMPCFSEDGKYIYYAGYTDRIGSIYRTEAETGITDAIYSESGINAYYPIVKGDKLYFTAWHSADNHCDRIMCYDGKEISSLTINSADYDCSDVCPIDGNKMIFSNTMNSSYDLYYSDGYNISPLSGLNTDINELGADFYSYAEYLENNTVKGDVNADGEFTVADLVLLQKWLLAVPDVQLKDTQSADFYRDERLDVFDFCMMRKELCDNNITE